MPHYRIIELAYMDWEKTEIKRPLWTRNIDVVLHIRALYDRGLIWEEWDSRVALPALCGALDQVPLMSAGKSNRHP